MTGKRTLKSRLALRFGVVALLVAVPTAYYLPQELLPPEFGQYPTGKWELRPAGK